MFIQETEIDVNYLVEEVLAEKCLTLLECSDRFSKLKDEFLCPEIPFEDLFYLAVEDLEMEEELENTTSLVIKAIMSINQVSFSFEKMWEIDRIAAKNEILRVLGERVSFWDFYNPVDFGFTERPKVSYIEDSGLYSDAVSVLEKLQKLQDKRDNLIPIINKQTP